MIPCEIGVLQHLHNELRDAVLTNVFNPKAALFFIAFLPQFINSSYPHTVVPFLELGLTFVFTGTIWCLILVMVSASVSERLRMNERFSSVLNKIPRIVLLALGAKLALAQVK